MRGARTRLGRRCMLAMLVVFACGVSAGSVQGAPKPKPKVLTYPGNAASGRKLFQQQQCGSCHMMAAANALDGDGMGPDLDHVTQSYAQIVAQISAGGHGMSAFKGILSTAQIEDIALFIYQTSHPK